MLVGPHNTQRASDAAPSPKRVTRESCRDIKGMTDQDVENKRHKKSIIMGDEVKQKSKGREAMDECNIIMKQPYKVQQTCFFSSLGMVAPAKLISGMLLLNIYVHTKKLSFLLRLPVLHPYCYLVATLLTQDSKYLAISKEEPCLLS